MDDDDYEEEVVGTSAPSIPPAEAEAMAQARSQEVRYLLQR